MLQREFLCNGMRGEFKYHLVDWQMVCLSKSTGGSGIRSISCMNQAFMGKWLWRFGKGEQGLWQDVVVLKYGVTSEGWWPREVRGSHGMGLWKAIMQGLNDFVKEIGFKMGEGGKVRFWKEV